MSIKGQLIRRLRMLRGISPSQLVSGISSVSYLSLMESDKRSVPPKTFIKFMQRLGIGPDSSPEFDFFRIAPEAAFELVKTYRAEGEFANSLSAGENFLRGITSQFPEFELQMTRLRGSLMNSALELGDFDRAGELLALELPMTKAITRVYSRWSHANYFEVLGDVQRSMNFYDLAVQEATDTVDTQTQNDLRQGFINSKLQIDAACDEDDFEFLNKCIARYEGMNDLSRLVLSRLTLAWFYLRRGLPDLALAELKQCEKSIPNLDLEVCGSVAESIADLCVLLKRTTTANELLNVIVSRAKSSDSTVARKLFWTRVGKAGKTSGSSSIVISCASALNMIAA